MIAFNTIYNLSLRRNCLNLTYFSSIRAKNAQIQNKTRLLFKKPHELLRSGEFHFFQDVLVGTLEVILQLSELFLLLYLNQYCSRSREAKPSTNKHREWRRVRRGVERGEDFLLCITHLGDANNLSLIKSNQAKHQAFISSCEMWLTFISG